MVKVIKIKSESIKLGQFLKFSGVIMTGGECKTFLEENVVKVNENRVQNRGKTLFLGDLIEINGQKYVVDGENETK